MITSEQRPALMKIEWFFICESSLKKIWTSSHVDSTGESALAANTTELAEMNEVNAQPAISEYLLVGQRDANCCSVFWRRRASCCEQ
jgi:hypothetical protein